jgi:hypothetical protein
MKKKSVLILVLVAIMAAMFSSCVVGYRPYHPYYPHPHYYRY